MISDQAGPQRHRLPALHARDAQALGLGKMHRVTSRVDTPETRGMIAKIPHLVQVVE